MLPPLSLNQFNYKKVKYRIYSILGIFNFDKDIDWDNVTDEELETYFYNADTLVDEEYCNDNNLVYKDTIDSENKYAFHTLD